MDITNAYKIHNTLRLLVGAVVFLFLMVGVLFYFQREATLGNRRGIECLLSQQVEFRYANKAAHDNIAEAVGTDYTPPVFLHPPTEAQVRQVSAKLAQRCNIYFDSK